MKQFPDATLPKIYPISAYTALAARDRNVPIDRDSGKVKDAAYYSDLEEKSRLGDFEDRLFRYLTEGERTREQLSEPVKKVSNVLQNEKADLEAQIKSLEESRSTSELEAQKLALEEGIANLQKERQTTTQPIRERFNKTLRDFKDKINAHCATIIQRTKTAAEDLEDIDDLQTFAVDLPATLKKQFVNLSQRLEDNLREDLMLVVDESGEYLDGLQETLSNVSGGELKLYNREFKLTAQEVGKDMEAMEKAFAEKRSQMAEIERAIESAEVNRAKARKLERERDDIQRQLREISNRRNAVLDTFTIPAVEHRTKTETKTRMRRGIGGFIAWIFVGDKEYQETTDVIDSTAHDEAIKTRDERLSKIDEEGDSLRKDLERYSNQSAGTSDEFDTEIQRKSKQLERLSEEYKAEVAQYMEKLDKDSKKLRRKICSQIADYTESFIEENVQGINKYLASIEGKMFDAVKTIIEARVNAELERQQKKMTKLIEDSKASDALRDEKLQKANAAIESVKRLLGCVVELEVELEEMNDIIEED